VVINETLVYFVGFYIIIKIWGALGGWPVAYWRIRRIPAFIQFIIEPDARISINPHKMNLIKTDTLAHFEFRNAEWFWGDSDCHGTRYGLSTVMHNFDDSRAVPFRKIGKERMAPIEIHKSYANKSIADLNRLGVKQPRGRFLLLLLLLVAVFILSEALIYYYNAACAANSPTCLKVG